MRKMPKYVQAVKGFDWGDVGRTAVGLGVLAVGTAVTPVIPEIGSLIAGYLSSRFICKSGFSKQFMMGVTVLNTIDIFMQRMTPRGVLG